MFTPLKIEKVNDYCTLDIETDKEGNVLDIGLYDGEQVKFFRSWDYFIEDIKQNIDQKKYCKFIAHCGGSFDYVSLVEYLTKHKNIKFDVIFSGSNICILKVYLGKPVIFQDSYQVLKESLAKLSDTFQVLDGKLKNVDRTDLKMLKQNDSELYYKYLGNDVKSLYQICKKFEKILEIKYFPPTIASLSLYIFRKKFLKKNLWQLTVKQDNFVTQSYGGGRVECFRAGHYDKVKVYDINSLYPSVMRSADIPDGQSFEVDQYQKKYLGFYKIKFEQKNKTLPPVLWQFSAVNGMEFVYEGEGSFYCCEIEKFLEIGGKIEIINGICWESKIRLFKIFVEHFYNLRLKNKGTALDLILKYLLNSQYGKYAEKPEKKKLIQRDLSLDQLMKKYESIEIFSERFPNLFIITEQRKVYHRLIQIASTITALSRVKLYNAIQNNIHNLVYCDTDSLHLTKNLCGKISDQLGDWKLENSCEGIYIGRKQYWLNGKSVFKGVDVKNKLLNGEVLEKKHYLKLLGGDKINFSYGAFPKIKTVLKRDMKSCMIYNIDKELQQSNYLTNFKGD